MAVAHKTDASHVGQTFAEWIRNDPAADGLFVQATRGDIHLWVLTEPLSFHDEDRFYRVGSDLHHKFPDATIHFHLVNPRLYGPDVELVGEVIPENADAIDLDTQA